MPFPNTTFISKVTKISAVWLQAVNDYIVTVPPVIVPTSLSTPSIVGVKQLLKTGPSTAIVLGYYAAGDGGGGVYWYDSSDVTSPDNGGTIIVALDGGRWKLFINSAISVKQFGAKCDATTDDGVAITAANAAAVAAGVSLLIPSTANITTATVITANLVSTYKQLFTTSALITITSGQTLRPEWWGADPTNTVESYNAFVAFFAACKGRKGELSGVYKVSTPLVVDYGGVAGLILEGIEYSLLASPGLPYNKCAFNFDGTPAASKALVFRGVRGLRLTNFFISQNLGIGSSLTRALCLENLEGFRLDGIYIEAKNGGSGSGFVFGNTGAADSAFMGAVTNCKAYTQGASFAVLPGCTSITFRNCYQSGGYFTWNICYYCSAYGCASEGAVLFAYVIDAVSSLTFTGCAGEGNGQGVFRIQNGSSNINLISPFGSGNNTSAIALSGDLISINSTGASCSNITISNPVSLNPNAATLSNIDATGGVTGYTEVTNIYAGTCSRGISGSTTFLQNYLSVSGDYSVIAFTPTIIGWTNVGVPTFAGKFTKRGSLVNWEVTITPATSIKTTLNTSQLVLPWGGPFLIAAESSAAVFDGANTSYGITRVQTNGVVWMPTTGILSTTLVVSGTLILP